MSKQILSEEFIRMQKLAGIITELQLNEDNLEVKSIAKKLYSWLKQNGVAVSLTASAMGGPDFKKIGIKDPKTEEATIAVWDDTKTKQTFIRVSLRGKESIVKSVEEKLLTTYPGLEAFNKQQYEGFSGNLGGQIRKIPGFINLTFDLKEKTTAKGGLAGNTKTNSKPVAQPQVESLNNENEQMYEAKEDLFNKYKSKIETLRDEFIADLKSNLKDLKKLSKEDKTKLSQMIRNLTGAVDDALSENKKVEDTE